MSTTADAPDIMSAEFAEDPYPLYQRLLEEYPLVWHEGLETFVVSRFEDVAAVLRDPAFVNVDWTTQIHGPMFAAMEGHKHAAQRAIVSPAVRGSELHEKHTAVIERTAVELIDVFRHTGEAELVEQFTSRLPINVTIEILGFPASDRERFRGWYDSIMRFFYNVAGDPEIIAEGMRTKAEIEAYAVPQIQDRREHPRQDLLTTLATAEVDGVQMTDLEAKACVSLLIVAGGETTDKTLASMFRCLVAHPDQLESVRADRSLIVSALAETLRFAPAVHAIPRIATQDTALSGGTVPSGRQVFCMVGAANRDHRRWSDPDAFNIHRDDLDAAKAFSNVAEHLTFGAGRHFCVGPPLAKHLVEIGTNLLLDAMDDISFADGVAPREVGGFSRGPAAVRLTFTPR